MSVPPPAPKPGGFIFQDPLGKRWPRLRRVLVLFGIIVVVAIIWFFRTLLVHPELKTSASIQPLKSQLKAAIKRTEQNDPNAINWVSYYNKSKAAQERMTTIRKQLKKAAKPKGEIRLGLYVEWDPNSFSSLEEHAGSLTHVAPEWFSVHGTDSELTVEVESRLTDFASSRGLTIMPVLRNLEGNTWQPEAVENLANGSADQRSRFIREVVTTLQKNKASGLIIDWQQIDPNYRDSYSDFAAQIADALHAAGMELWFMISVGEDFKTFRIFEDPDAKPDQPARSKTLEEIVDRFVVVLHDENSDSDAPGPIASQPWLEGWLKVIEESGDPSQWIAMLGAYAYDWNTTTKKTETITFKDAMSRASYAGVDKVADRTQVGPPSYNGIYEYSEPGGEHTVSFLDAISFYDQAQAVRAKGFSGLGISRLGAEDPQIWDVMELKGVPAKGALKALGTMRTSDTITHVGRGEIVSVDAVRDDGARIVTLDDAGMLNATYTDFPTYPILYHQGAGGAHEVAITFDDGPDPEWTPKILDVLRERGVKATFFLIGKNCENERDLVRRILAEGHEVGNHTYSHRNLAIMSEWQMRLELDATQRLIQSITGRSTTLFRPPYNADSTPTDIAELAPLKLAQEELGYTIVLEKIDPQDWARPGVDEIVQRVKDLRDEGNIILLHDAGGDRSQTLEALPRIIDYVQTRGDRIVSLSELLQIPRDELMPVVDERHQPMERMVASTGFHIWHGVVEFFWAFMIFSTGLIVVRTAVVAWLAHRNHQRHEEELRVDPHHTKFAPALSVVIAAYNEGKVIAKTLKSVVETTYTGEFEVLVVDDGSKDNTAEEIQRVAAEHPQIRLIRQPNGGKSAALRAAINQVAHQIIVFLDADTMLEPGTLHAIVQPLSHPLTGAVSGNARVGNLRTFVARCQSLEYICGFNLDRRAYTEWNCITVVPGAISAVRTSAIASAGGFSHDTLAEDTDLTLTLHRLGYRIAYAPDAVAWTEAPETFSTLARQRFRWAFGTMQCLWKHRDMVFNPRFGALGWFSLPNVWFMQIGLVALTPIVDLVLLYSLIFGISRTIWPWFAAVLLVDLFVALLACWMEGEPLRRAFRILPMRFVYRPLLAQVIWKSIFHAFKGAFVAWGKLERTASVTAPQAGHT